ncbi:MAG: Cof-type HAD-IIB family hydrolase [Alkalibacterium sp.]|uniref:Cof-type HAD-IIB family hydrolase n=1 Tax=Alkalibacterium sp. TaxID=1872447 RepID=UPI0039708861
MENKKLFIFDIDGTVLDDNKAIPVETKQAIKELNKSHEVAIATGRNRTMAREVIEELGISNYIVCNGAAAYYNHEAIYTNFLDKEELQKLIKLADENNHQLVYETIDDLRRRSETPDSRVKNGMQFVGFSIPEHNRDFHKTQSLVQCLLFVSEDEMEIYKNQFSHFRFVRWYKTGVDILPGDGSKFLTIKILANHLGINLKDVVAFGDGMNDIEMIKNVGFGIAMGNAEKEVKDVANSITDSNENNGIPNALRQLNYIS